MAFFFNGNCNCKCLIFNDFILFLWGVEDVHHLLIYCSSQNWIEITWFIWSRLGNAMNSEITAKELQVWFLFLLQFHFMGMQS